MGRCDGQGCAAGLLIDPGRGIAAGRGAQRLPPESHPPRTSNALAQGRTWAQFANRIRWTWFYSEFSIHSTPGGCGIWPTRPTQFTTDLFGRREGLPGRSGSDAPALLSGPAARECRTYWLPAGGWLEIPEGMVHFLDYTPMGGQ